MIRVGVAAVTLLARVGVLLRLSRRRIRPVAADSAVLLVLGYGRVVPVAKAMAVGTMVADVVDDRKAVDVACAFVCEPRDVSFA